jgi:hypothetical protein
MDAFGTVMIAIAARASLKQTPTIGSQKSKETELATSGTNGSFLRLDGTSQSSGNAS